KTALPQAVFQWGRTMMFNIDNFSQQLLSGRKTIGFACSCPKNQNRWFFNHLKSCCLYSTTQADQLHRIPSMLCTALDGSSIQKPRDSSDKGKSHSNPCPVLRR